ncbi:MAG: thioredoxin family protein [Candidatus Altiarchaeota archaeon]|nr:thioredoxin family protein [Candidatus Altiarchaeota archaeon]
MNKLLILFGIVMIGSLLYLGELAVKNGTTLGEPYPKAPELEGISEYLNSNENLSITNLKGKVILIDFWTYSCVNCIRTLPHLVRWNDMYKDKGLVIIGVHTPEFDFEKKVENVQAALDKYGIEYPVVMDNDYATWKAFENRYWPHKFLIDSKGFIRYHHIGEGKYDETENIIQTLLLEVGQDTSDVVTSNLTDKTPSRPQTPELYAGHAFALPRGQNLGNEEGMQPGSTFNYSLPNNIDANKIYLSGSWISGKDALTAHSDGEIILRFLGSSANIVVENQNETLSQILINDKFSKDNQGDDINDSVLKTFSPALYNIYRGDYGYTKLTIKVKKGFSFNAFTFG